MRNSIQNKAVILVLATSIIFTGCSQNSEDKMKDVDATKTKWGSETLDKNLSANFEMTEKIPEEIYTYKIERENFSVKEGKKLFFPNDQGKEKYSVTDFDPNDKSLGKYEELTTDTGLELISNIDGFGGETGEYIFLRNALFAEDIQADDEKHSWEMSGDDTELPNLSKEEVTKRVTEQMEKVWKDTDISISNIYFRTYSADYLNKLTRKILDGAIDDVRVEKFNKDDTKEWKENEGVYYIRIEFFMNGMMLNARDIDQNIEDGIMPKTFYAELYYNEDGCISVNFEYFKVIQNEENEIVPVSYAVEAVKNNITSVILSDEQKFEINDAKLCYTWIQGEEKEYAKASIKPVWIITVKYSDQEIDGFNDKYFVDAVTGEVMETR